VSIKIIVVNNNQTLLGKLRTQTAECQLLAFQAVDTLAWLLLPLATPLDQPTLKM
jgi:hypothetical protein